LGGARTTEAVPRNYGASTSMIATLSIDGVEAPMLIEGSVDTLVFNAYCEQVLRPTLIPGDIIVLDNLGAHRARPHRRGRCFVRAHVLWLRRIRGLFSDRVDWVEV
jgi:transposase